MQVEECVLCPRLVACRRQIVNGVGRPTAKIMFVGQNPGEEEDIEGKPFMGKSGNLLRLLCDSAGINPIQVYRTNAVRCHSPGNAKPKKDEILNCRDYLIDEIREVNPAVIIALGEVPIQSLYSFAGDVSHSTVLMQYQDDCADLMNGWQSELETWNLMTPAGRKEYFPSGRPKKPKLPAKPRPAKPIHTAVRDVAGHTLVQPDTGIPLIASYHPAFLMRGNWQMSELVIAHFEKARRIAEAA